MKIGDEVMVHGYIDEIRNDIIIIRNEGGYFGTVPSEICKDAVEVIRCKDCTGKNEQHTTSRRGDIWWWCNILELYVDGNGYCSCGERRTK